MLYFTSDLHFFHANILTFCEKTRPFSTVEEMHQAIIDNWNATVTDHDEVHVLGDFAFSSKSRLPEIKRIFDSLAGKKHLILGNHDVQTPNHTLGWESVEHYNELRYRSLDGEKYHFVLSHYPMATWHKAHRGSLMLHGHCHGGLRDQVAHRYDVGIDGRWGLSPVSAETIIAVSKTEEYNPVDHHGA